MPVIQTHTVWLPQSMFLPQVQLTPAAGYKGRTLELVYRQGLTLSQVTSTNRALLGSGAGALILSGLFAQTMQAAHPPHLLLHVVFSFSCLLLLAFPSFSVFSFLFFPPSSSTSPLCVSPLTWGFFLSASFLSASSDALLFLHLFIFLLELSLVSASFLLPLRGSLSSAHQSCRVSHNFPREIRQAFP